MYVLNAVTGAIRWSFASAYAFDLRCLLPVGGRRIACVRAAKQAGRDTGRT